MTEHLQSAGTAGFPHNPHQVKMENDLSPRKTMLVLVIVVGCFAVLWPKVFYPMLVGSAIQHIKPSPIDKTTGCCDVISETDINTIKIMSELCGTIIKSNDEGKTLTGKEIVTKCKQEVLDTCGIDISNVLQDQVRLGDSVKQILDQIRSLNGSLCLKYNYGVAPWRLGVPHRVTVKVPPSNVRQERPLHLRSELIHPAFRERGRAIPEPHSVSPSRPPPRVIEGRPGPIPGMRPTIGGAGHVVPPSKQGTSSMSVIMPIYTIGIVIFFTYTLMKIIFKKQPEGVGGSLYPPIDPDPHFRKEVFESESSRLGSRITRDSISSKLGDAELDHLRQRLRETELAMERIVEQMSKVPLKTQDMANGNLSNGEAVKPQDNEEQPIVKVMGMEMTASCEGGKKWSRPDSPVLPTSPSPPPLAEPVPPPQEIYLEGALPAQSQLLVADSATEAQQNSEDDPAVVLAGKMTLSVISLDSENGEEDEHKENETHGEIKKEIEDAIVEVVEAIPVISSTVKEIESEISQPSPVLTNEGLQEHIGTSSELEKVDKKTKTAIVLSSENLNEKDSIEELSALETHKEKLPESSQDIKTDINSVEEIQKEFEMALVEPDITPQEKIEEIAVKPEEENLSPMTQIEEIIIKPEKSDATTTESIEVVKSEETKPIEQLAIKSEDSVILNDSSEKQNIEETNEKLSTKALEEEVHTPLIRLDRPDDQIECITQSVAVEEVEKELDELIKEALATVSQKEVTKVEEEPQSTLQEIITEELGKPIEIVTDDEEVCSDEEVVEEIEEIVYESEEEVEEQEEAEEEEDGEEEEEEVEEEEEESSDIDIVNVNTTESSRIQRVNGERSEDYVEEPKTVTLSATTAAENDISDEELTDNEEVEDEEEEVIEIEEVEDEQDFINENNDVNHISRDLEADS